MNDPTLVIPERSHASRSQQSGREGELSITRLYLTSVLGQRLKAMVCTGYPEETCGLLVGYQSKRLVQVWDLVQARNLNRERARDRYELDPRDFVATDAMARRQAMEIVGIWHSHPDHPARPSETDQAAAWAGWSYVIASVSREGMEDLRSWRLSDEGFTEEVIEYDWYCHSAYSHTLEIPDPGC